MSEPLPIRLAFAWTGFVTAALWFGLSMVFAVFGRNAEDIVLLGATQVVIYALVLSLFRLVQGESVSEMLALRPASLRLCLAAAALGVVLQVPATVLSNAVDHFFPLPKSVLAERMARITPHSSAHGIAIFIVVAGFGPCIEEFFFRGALFGALRQRQGALLTNAVVSLCFALGHLDPHLLLPLVLAAWVMGDVREHSGSIWPGFALHAAFNSATLAVVFSGEAKGGSPPAVPAWFAILAAVSSVALLFWIRKLAPRRPVVDTEDRAQGARSGSGQ